MSKLQVAVLRGGPSLQYDLSLQTGATVLNNMPEKYQAHDILISKDGIWHREGLERSPDRALSHIDVVFNALHGEYGEDGKVQRILDSLAIPYTGSGAIASSLGMNKILSKKIFEQHNIKTPYYAVIKREDNLQDKIKHVFNHFFLPIVVKPATSSASMGATLVQNFDDLEAALEYALLYSEAALVEEYIRGKEATAGVIDNFRGETTYALLPVEMVQNNLEQEEVDSNDTTGFSDYERHEIQRLAQYLHKTLGLKHYSHSDFIVTPRRGIYVLEVNTHPSITPDSILTRALHTVDVTVNHFIDHIISLAHGKR